jgi:hypothetical protein
MKKVFLSLFCAGAILTGSVQAQTGDCATPDASGATGSLTWTLCPDGTLTISGNGEMPHYDDTSFFRLCSRFSYLNRAKKK